MLHLYSLVYTLHSKQNGPGNENGQGWKERADRTNLTLPGHQMELIKAVHATGARTVLVLINSGALLQMGIRERSCCLGSLLPWRDGWRCHCFCAIR